MKIYILTPVWGTSFVGVFLQFVLPCLASEGNLPTLAREHEVIFRIYTTPEDAQVMAASPLIHHLASFMTVEFPDLDAPHILEAMKRFDRTEVFSYRRSAGCVADGLKQAWKDQAGVLFIAPDNVYSDGSLARVARAIQAGKRGVMLLGMAVSADTFLPALEGTYPLNEAGARTVPPRGLAHLGLRYRTPWMEGAFLGSANSFDVHSSLFWATEQGGYLARSWHLQPLFLHPHRCWGDYFIGQDNDLVGLLVKDARDLDIVTDSDELIYCDIHPPNSERFSRKVNDPFSPLRFALAAEQVYVSPHNFYNVRQGLRFHDVDLTPDWETLDRESDLVVDDIQLWMTFLDPGSWSAPRSLDARHEGEALGMLDHLQQETEGADVVSCAFAWANLGKLHAALGHREAALQAFARVLDLRPDFPRSVLRVAWAALNLDSPELAERAIQRAREIAPDHFELKGLDRVRTAKKWIKDNGESSQF